MSESILSLVGFLTIAIILLMLNRKWAAPFVAIAVVPMLACILIGQGASLSDYVSKGVSSIATNGVLFMFSVTFFGIMSDTGAFDPFINAIIKATKGDPVRLMVGTCAFALVGHLDGSGVTTCLLVVPPMMPIFKRLHMRNTSLAMALGLIAGIMNCVPWGGPTMRAASALEMDVMELWIPFIPTQIFGLVCAVIMCIFIGRAEKKRLIAEGLLKPGAEFNLDEYLPKLTEEEMKLRRPKMMAINWILIIGVLGLMCASVVKPVVSFMAGVALALMINYRDAETQRRFIEEKGKDAILLCSVIFGAGILMGVMGNSGMSTAMANTLVNLIPASLSKFIAPIIGLFSIPLHILFDADSYYYGIMPVIVETAEALGVAGVDIARASMIGQTTLGWPLSPMVGTFFLFTGICELDIGEWQKYAFKYFMIISTLMTIFACVTGLIV